MEQTDHEATKNHRAVCGLGRSLDGGLHRSG